MQRVEGSERGNSSSGRSKMYISCYVGSSSQIENRVRFQDPNPTVIEWRAACRAKQNQQSSNTDTAIAQRECSCACVCVCLCVFTPSMDDTGKNKLLWCANWATVIGRSDLKRSISPTVGFTRMPTTHQRTYFAETGDKKLTCLRTLW